MSDLTIEKIENMLGAHKDGVYRLEARDNLAEIVEFLLDHARQSVESTEPIPLILFCPACGHQHIDEGEWATKPHKTHLCEACETDWRPSMKPTVGVRMLEETGAPESS